MKKQNMLESNQDLGISKIFSKHIQSNIIKKCCRNFFNEIFNGKVFFFQLKTIF